MAEYIEREVAIRTAVDAAVEIFDCHTTFHLLKLANKIREIPTADVVEVVRCKDCEYRYVPCHCALWYGTICGKEYFIERGDDFSCSYGKRKEGAEE